MDKFRLDGPADAKAELEQLLELNGIAAAPEGRNYRFLLSSRGLKWETLCCPTEDGAVLIYGIYPFRAGDGKKAEAFCRRVNDEARYGAMLYRDGMLIYRIGADLFDTFSAYETLGRVLEYSAGIMTRFWVQASTASESSSAPEHHAQETQFK